MTAQANVQAARITLERVTKRFGQTVAVEEVSLQIEPGSLVNTGMAVIRYQGSR